MNLWARLLADLETAIADATRLEPSPLPFNVGHIPETLTGEVFSVDVQTSNTGKDRERTTIRARHLITVEMLHAYNMSGGRQEAEIDAMTKELQIIDALMAQATFPSYRISWLASRRTRTPTLTHLLTSITFDAEHSFSIVSDDAEAS